MAQTQVNTEFPIHNADGSLFHNIKLRNVVSDSVVMSLGDKITGDAYYIDNTLTFTMGEYIEVDVNLGGTEWRKVNYYLVNPPTVVKEGMVADNGDLKGMTKYSFEFYHPMYLLGNFPFTDVAVSSDELKYLSQNKKFSWIGKPQDFINKLNKNLQGTEWVVVMSSAYPQEKKSVLSEVLTFANQTIADALKTAYDTWEVPYIVDSLRPNEYSYIDEHNVQRDYYDDGKRFVVVFGLPSNEIIVDNEPFVFHYGKGVGLKNNSRTPRNNKIVTRISGSGSERNIPYGYPQIRWYGNQDWDYTINNNPNDPHSYPIYKGIVGGQYVKLIKHPFTRKNLMPSIYSQTVFNKVSPYLEGGTTNPDYDPDTTIIDYYDAVATQEYHYVNEINLNAPSFDIHEFEDVYPRLNEAHIIDAYVELDDDLVDWILYMDLIQLINPKYVEAVGNGWVDDQRLLSSILLAVESGEPFSEFGSSYNVSVVKKEQGKNTFYVVNYRSEHFQFNVTSLPNGVYDVIPVTWDDTMDDEGNYNQSYFHIKLPVLSFDLYACASITEQMDINMRSGACMGCTFTVQVDWEDYKKNFYDENGEFAPQGQQRDYTKYPDSSQGQIDVIVQKDIETFGTIMPNISQQPKGESSEGSGDGDEFVFLGISLPLSYISNAEVELDDKMKTYMLENNVYYYDYPLKFDEAFLYEHEDIAAQIRPNTVIRFVYANEDLFLFVKQLTIKYNEGVLPKYDITLTDNVEVVLNQIAQVEVLKTQTNSIANTVSKVEKDYVNQTELANSETKISAKVKGEIDGKISETGIDIEQGVINLMAGKVNFLMDSATPNAKISIDPETGALTAVNGIFSGDITGGGLLIKDGNGNVRVTIKPDDLPAALTEAFFQSYLGYGGLLLGGDSGKVYARFDVNGVEFRYGGQSTYEQGATGIKIGINGIEVPYKLSSDYLSAQNYVPYDGFQQGIKVLTESDFETAEAMYCGMDVDYQGQSKVYLVQPSDSVLIVTDIANTGSSATIKYGICLGDGAGTDTNNSSNTVKPRIGRKIKIINATAGDTFIHVFGGGNIWMNIDSRTMMGYRDVTFGGVDNYLFLGTYMDSNKPSWFCEPYYR